jgi:probable HAF family extracellular repeat protein
MKRSFDSTLTIGKFLIIGGTAALLNLSWGSTAIAAALYTLTDLGALTGGDSSYATGINNNGDVVGQSATSEGFRAFLWNPTTGMTNLGALSGGNYSYATGVNDQGQVVGYTNGSSGSRAFVWNKTSGLLDLGTVSNGLRSYAYGINNSGQIAGYSDTGTDRSTVTVWNGSHAITDLGEKGISSIATAINDRNQIAGQVVGPNGFRATLWDPTQGLTQLGTLAGGSYSYATGLNDRGDVVGYSAIGGQTPTNSSSTTTFGGLSGNTVNAFLWNSTQGIMNLGSLSPQDNSYAQSINENRQVVGYSYGLDNGSYRYRATIWNNGVINDLNSLVDPALGWSLRVANAINDKGQVVGIGFNPTGQSRAFLLTPTAVGPNPELTPAPTPVPTPPVTSPSPILTPTRAEPRSC